MRTKKNYIYIQHAGKKYRYDPVFDVVAYNPVDKRYDERIHVRAKRQSEVRDKALRKVQVDKQKRGNYVYVKFLNGKYRIDQKGNVAKFYPFTNKYDHPHLPDRIAKTVLKVTQNK